MILSALACDAVIVATLSIWTSYQSTWRLPISLTCVYALKVMMRQLFAMRTPENYAWQYPGFYSLSVKYGLSNDTHFVLHCAILTVCFYELWEVRSMLLIPSIITLTATIFLLMVLRGCFMIDIFGAVIFGQFAWHFANRVSYFIDVKVFGLHFQERFPYF